MDKKPNCFKCSHKRELVWNCHIACANHEAHVEGTEHGARMGWFNWPYNFDPVWLRSCDGFEAKP